MSDRVLCRDCRELLDGTKKMSLAPEYPGQQEEEITCRHCRTRLIYSFVSEPRWRLKD